ncbi:hypothetical protein DFJ58DRAFT_886434 [Suillus subalutaceus]|uniref:uncharacterized protein n=1 Tax=Suillus subalutaceus TaxID=48586 RepID=UPI001B8795EE|nr:uncharacterized protein DFJ58DRAFT_886434 [Suillus subalutaceus]KAG1851483.1 hypothetical protein DFJ58DRAFT_886434 [Suillus subalutaceus]
MTDWGMGEMTCQKAQRGYLEFCFGLSDGEGCERLWSALKHLIAPLRVSGFHQRLFVLNTQVRHLDDKNLVLFGNWLSRRWNNCVKKKSIAMQALHKTPAFDLNRKIKDNLCANLSALIRQRRSPPNAIAPNPISPAGIFDLDIDADIWQDIGLDDVVLEPPDWLADEATRAAIKLVLEIDRCNEEESRVKVECYTLQEWAIAQWDALQRACAHAKIGFKLVKKFLFMGWYISWRVLLGMI